MKIKMTQKQVREVRPKCISFGYCDLQELFNTYIPDGYVSNYYGWQADVYLSIAEDVTVTSGYKDVAGRLVAGSEYVDLLPNCPLDELSWEERKQLLRAIVARATR